MVTPFRSPPLVVGRPGTNTLSISDGVFFQGVQLQVALLGHGAAKLWRPH